MSAAVAIVAVIVVVSTTVAVLTGVDFAADDDQVVDVVVNVVYFALKKFLKQFKAKKVSKSFKKIKMVLTIFTYKIFFVSVRQILRKMLLRDGFCFKKLAPFLSSTDI